MTHHTDLHSCTGTYDEQHLFISQKGLATLCDGLIGGQLQLNLA